MAGFDAGAIVVDLKLSKDKWNSALKSVGEDQKKISDDTKKHSAGIIESVEKIAKSWIGVSTAVVGALTLLTNKAADYGDMLAKTSQKTGIAVETLSGLKLAADHADVGIEGLATGLNMMARFASEASLGTQRQVEILQRLGIQVTDNTGKLKPMDEMLGLIADKFKVMPDGTEKAALAMDIFGRSGVQMIPLLNQGSEGLKREREEAERLGLVMSGPAAKAAEEYNDQMTTMKGAFMGITVALGQILMPIIKSGAEIITNLSVVVRTLTGVLDKNKDAVIVLGTAIALYFAGEKMQAAISGVRVFLSHIALMPGKCFAATAALKGLATGMTGTIAVFAGLIAVGKVLIDTIKALSDNYDLDTAAIYRDTEAQKKSIERFREMAKVAGISKEAIRELSIKHKDVTDAGMKHEKMLRDLIKTYPELAKKLREKNGILGASIAISDAVKAANLSNFDAIQKATLKDYQYAVWATNQKYNAQKESLEKERANSDALFLNERARQAELTQIYIAETEKRKVANKKFADDALATWGQLFDKMRSFAGAGERQIEKELDKIPKYVGKIVMETVKDWNAGTAKIKSGFQQAIDGINSAVGKFSQKFGGAISGALQAFSTYTSAMDAKSDARFQKEFAMMDAAYAKQKALLDTEYNDKIEAINNSLMSEEEKAAAIEALEQEKADALAALEEEQAAKKLALEIKQAEAKKKSGITQAIIGVALAVISAMSTVPFIPMGLIAAAMAVVAGAIQISAIKSAPLPTMEHGGLLTQATQVIAGEAGPEAFVPLPELKEMLGVSKGSRREMPNINFSIKAMDGADVERVTNRRIIPLIKKAMNRESLRVPARAVG